MLISAIFLMSSGVSLTSGDILRSNGWNFSKISASSVENCDASVDIDRIKTRSMAFYKNDKINNLFKLRFSKVVCLKNSDMALAFFDEIPLMHCKPVFIVSISGNLLGKYLSLM